MLQSLEYLHMLLLNVPLNLNLNQKLMPTLKQETENPFFCLVLVPDLLLDQLHLL
jgi:hypothetical protein